jgi:pimeloyl-ACP methyl ester carboxylesterase
LNRIFNEQDVVLFGARLAPQLGLISPAENNGLVPTLAETYGKMQGATPLSPFLLTYLNQQSPNAFDVVIAQPPIDTPPKRAIVFLHGYGGNFTLQCWLMAHAGDRIGALTICPSTGPSGDWWSPYGEAILQQTLSYLHQRGIERIYLAGLSNGGIGVSRLAQRLEAELAGLILISGADPDAPISGLPVLVVQGKDDQRIPKNVVERYVAAAGTSSTYLLLEGDHFVLLKQADQLQGAIADWIIQQEAH